MSTDSLHGVLWLSMIEGFITPVDRPDETTLMQPTDLPNVRMELHWFANPKEGFVFTLGIREAGRNTVQAVQGLGEVANCVLILRQDEPAHEGEGFEDVIPLTEHTSANARRSKLVWKNAEMAILRLSPYQGSTFKRVSIERATPDEMLLTVRYERWPDEQDDIQKGLRQDLVLQNRSEGLGIEWSVEGLRDMAAFGLLNEGGWMDELRSVIERKGGSLENGLASFKVVGPLDDAIANLGPVFAQCHQIEYRAVEAAKIARIEADPVVIRIGKAMLAGATLLGGRPPILRHVDGREVKVPALKVNEMVRAGLLADAQGMKGAYRYIKRQVKASVVSTSHSRSRL